MPEKKNNTIGVEVTIKYATCQNNNWKWYLVKLFIILFTRCLRVHLLMLFLYKPEICLKCHFFMQNCISMICYKKMLEISTIKTMQNRTR